MSEQGRKFSLAIFVGIFSVAVVGFLMWFGVLQTQEIKSLFAAKPKGNFHIGCVTSGKSGQTISVNDSDSRITYEKTWGSSTSGWQNGYHFAVKTHPALAHTYEGSTATLKFKGNKVSVTTLNYSNRGYLEAYIDGELVETIDLFDPNDGTHPTTWSSPELSCGEHTFMVKQSEKARTLNSVGRQTRLVVIDGFSYQECAVVPASVCGYVPGKGTNQDGCAKLGGKCGEIPLAETHLECQNQTCVKVSGGGGNLDGCEVEGAACQDNQSDSDPDEDLTEESMNLICQDNACVRSTTVSSSDPTCDGKNVGDVCGNRSEDLKCQGNTDAPARCFDCKKDTSVNASASEINILDFSCFAKYYGKEVGAP